MEEAIGAKGADMEFELALAALAADETLTALSHIEKALLLRDAPEWYSFLGVCIARERGQFRKGLELCQTSLAAEPDNPVHFLNLGRVHLAGGDKIAALHAVRQGMSKGGNPELLQLLERLGTRRRPVISALSRSNPINKFLGMLLSRMGIR